VWPHDSALAAAGIASYGFHDAAQRIVDGLLDASEAFDGRLPELFCGFDREEKPRLVPYPTSCSPQAWAAAVPFELLRLSLRLSPSASARRLDVGASPRRLGSVEIDNLTYEERQYQVRADGNGAKVVSQAGE
jgi:glycogen debranching enzyme